MATPKFSAVGYVKMELFKQIKNIKFKVIYFWHFQNEKPH